MKKMTLKTFALLSVLILASCSSDDDNNSTAEDMNSLILGTWAETLTITPNGYEIVGSIGCPDTWKFLQNTIEIKSYSVKEEPPCGSLYYDGVHEYEIVDNLLKIFRQDGTPMSTYRITELTTTNLTVLSSDNSTYKYVKQ